MKHSSDQIYYAVFCPTNGMWVKMSDRSGIAEFVEDLQNAERFGLVQDASEYSKLFMKSPFSALPAYSGKTFVVKMIEITCVISDI